MKEKQPSPSLRLETERMVLRAPQESDHDFLMHLYANPAVMKYIHHLGQADTPAEAEDRFRRLLAHWEDHGFGMFFMEWKESGQPIGYCGPRILHPDENPELGYMIDQPYWGQGLVLEAAKRSVEFVRDHLKAPGMIALTAPDNGASQKILTKLGFQRNPARDGAFHGDDSCFFELFFSEKTLCLETKRLVLRPPRESDRAFFRQLYANPVVMKYSHPRGQADSPEEAEQRFGKFWINGNDMVSACF